MRSFLLQKYRKEDKLSTNKKDLTGHKFNSLTAIERLANYKNNKTYYRCKCDCGNERIVCGYDLTSGKFKTCKECTKSKPSIRRKDYTGKRFGRLVIDEMLYNYNDTHTTYANCTCDCGNHKIISMPNIVAGHTQSCGCYEQESRFKRENHEKDITGQRFGNLLVLSKTKQRDINSSVVWKCLCDCGNITYSNSSNLKRGHTTSCGCNKQKYIDSLKIDVKSGDKYGFLTIIKEIEPRGHRRFECLCECGKIVEISLSDLRSQHTQSCGCKNISKGEKYIESLLKEYNINYTSQKRFEDCKNIRSLPFDFYLDDYNTCIEYQGEQHYKAIDFWGGEESFQYRQNNDNIKKKYCEDNNINLICLPYTLSNDEIKQVLIDFLDPVTTTVA